MALRVGIEMGSTGGKVGGGWGAYRHVGQTGGGGGGGNGL